MITKVSSISKFTTLSPTPPAHCQSYLRRDIVTPRMVGWPVEEEETATTAGPLVWGGTLSPAPGHNLTLSARGDMVMCPGPQRMECISWEEMTAAAGRPQNLSRLMDQLREGSASNIIQGKINTAINLTLCYLYLWQVCLCHPWHWKWGGHYCYWIYTTNHF